MRGALILLLMVLLVAPPPVWAAGPRVGQVVNVSNDQLTDNEVTLAVNPLNPNNLIAGWNDWDLNNGVGYTYSFDGGKTWAPRTFIPHVTNVDNEGDPADGKFQVAGDPYFVFGPDGSAYAIVQGFNVTPPFEIQMLVLRSTDGGQTWGRPIVASVGEGEGETRGSNGQFPDRESAAVDLSPLSPYRGTLYVAWAQFHGLGGRSPIMLSYLRPGAQAFSTATLVSDLPGGFAQNATPVVGPDGAVYVTFIAYNPQIGLSGTYIARSDDGGRSFGPSHFVAPFLDPVNGTLPNSEYRVFSFPVAAFDAARNRVVVAWNDRLNGVSTTFTSTCRPDDLNHCSAPLRVTPSSTGEQFFPALSAAPNGRVDLLFYDRSRDPGNRLNFLTYAHSGDGGSTWNTLNVTRTPFDGEAQTTPSGTPFIGDYIGVASTNATAYLAWTGNGKDTVCTCNQEIFAAPVIH